MATMGLLDSRQLSALRARLATAQDGQASIVRALPATRSATGGIVEQSTVVAASVACRFTFKSVPGPDVTNPGAFVWIVQWTLTFPYGTDVQVGDQVTDLVSGRVFHVQGVLSPRTIELTTRVVAQEVR